MLKSQDPQTMLQSGRQQVAPYQPAIESLKNPYVLEFLGLPDTVALAGSPLKHVILMALNTGMRKAEIYNLEWVNINLLYHAPGDRRGEPRVHPENVLEPV